MADAPELSGSVVPLPSSATPQADPLPPKQGELEYDAQLHSSQALRQSSSSPMNLPARHPADRDATASATDPPTPSPDPPVPSSNSQTDTASTRQRHFLKFLDSKKIPAYWGLRLTTLCAFFLQFCIVGGTGAAWVITMQKVSASQRGDGASQMMGSSSGIFVHVVFAIAILGQLIFLERRIFMLRAQRYSYIHPGQILPSTRFANTSLGVDPVVAWSPWNRPPLPTYAAALAQSGVGTGDVEDHLIAQPPPPAYGNTRGSTMILQGFLRNSLRIQRPPSVHSQASRSSLHSAPGNRPLSYRSMDSGWEVIQDADRARQLEETLASLERPQRAASPTSTRGGQ